MNAPWGPFPLPSEIGSRHEKVTFLAGMGAGAAVGLGLGELTATDGVDAACAWGIAVVPQAQTNTISARPAHLMPVERALLWNRYRSP